MTPASERIGKRAVPIGPIARRTKARCAKTCSRWRPRERATLVTTPTSNVTTRICGPMNIIFSTSPARSDLNESALRENLLSLATTRARHVGDDPNVERHDPDLWTDEYYFLNQPGQIRSERKRVARKPALAGDHASAPRW